MLESDGTRSAWRRSLWKVLRQLLVGVLLIVVGLEIEDRWRDSQQEPLRAPDSQQDLSRAPSTVETTPENVQVDSEQRRPGQTIKNRFGMELVWIPSGKFMMGSCSSEADIDEQPMKDLLLSNGFYLGKYEVKNREWAMVMDTSHSGSSGRGPDYPVQNISWVDVQEFLRRLNRRDPERVYRLPTEKEWEYAARGGIPNPPNEPTDRYGELDDIACYEKTCKDGPDRVGSWAPNEYGLHDMLGNVWEWTSTVIRQHPVRRGGSWYSSARACRASYRVYGAPVPCCEGLGFRIVSAVGSTDSLDAELDCDPRSSNR